MSRFLQIINSPLLDYLTDRFREQGESVVRRVGESVGQVIPKDFELRK